MLRVVQLRRVWCEQKNTMSAVCALLRELRTAPVEDECHDELTVVLLDCSTEEPERAEEGASEREQDPQDTVVVFLDMPSEHEPGAPPATSRTAYDGATVEELRGLCKRHALRVRGTKTELVARLVEALG